MHNIIYADPAWDFNNKKTGGSLKSGAASIYSTMSLDAIQLLDVPAIAADDSVLFMWWVGSQPQEALDLVKAWDFTLKTMTGFTWVKKTKHWKNWFGMGFWTRQGTENMLIATKGKPKRVSAGIRQVVETDDFNESIEARVEGHSKKPDIFADRIVQLMGDLPRVELFARDHKLGWNAWGNEIETNIVL